MVLTAAAADGLTVDGRPFDGEVRLAADTGPVGTARVALGGRRLVVLVREGVWGVRDFDTFSDLTPRSRSRRGSATWSEPGHSGQIS